MEQTLHKIQNFCAKHFGISVDALSLQEWQRKIKHRLVATSTDTFEDYYQMLSSSPEECQEFIETLIVPETWFYRDKAAFEYLTQYCLNQFQRPIHVLSIPCGSGEEAYTISMAFLENGFRAKDYSIDGIDISKKALQQAEEGLYQKRSFRGKSLGFRETYFNEESGSYRIKQEVRESVRFWWGNVIDSSIRVLKGKYEAIFCRNLLIYLHEEARKQVFDRVKELLAPNGLLFVAPAEVDEAKHHGFCSAGPSRTCALGLAKPESVDLAKDVPAQDIQPIVPSKHVLDEQKLSQAHLIADLGDYMKAEQLCLEHLKNHGDDANAYYLLGVISHAKNQIELAKDYFNRAIYLEPEHADALFYLALLAEQQGDAKQAALLRKRARQQ